jgi:hypothetical protein
MVRSYRAHPSRCGAIVSARSHRPSVIIRLSNAHDRRAHNADRSALGPSLLSAPASAASWRRYIEERNFSFLPAAGSGPVFLSDKQIVLALSADLFRGESPADFCAVDHVEVHRRAFVFQLLQARKFFQVDRKTTHLLHQKKGGDSANVLQQTCESNELKSIIPVSAAMTCYCARELRLDLSPVGMTGGMREIQFRDRNSERPFVAALHGATETIILFLGRC